MNTRHRILCIEDDQRQQVTMKTILEGAGHDVWSAATGQEGLALAKKQPDLIILDIALPDMGGFAVCRMLKSDAETQRIPVLHLSGQFNEDNDRAAGLEGGAEAYLVKPTTNRVLLATIGSLLRMHDAEQSLAEALRKAEAANEAKDRFLSRITGQLRLPLNGIVGASGLLTDSALTPRQRKAADSIRGNSQRLLVLVNDLLDAACLDLSGVELEDVELGPRLVCKDVFTMLHDKADAKALVLDCICSPEVPKAVRVDAGRFMQVLTHLVENAIQFTPKGTVTVRMAMLGNQGDVETLRIEVEDTGPGVPDELETSLFKPLASLMVEHPAAGSGPGLGLAIAHAVVELMGGSMGYRPAEKGGALFWFEMPAPAPLVTTPEPTVGKEPHGSEIVRVLLVDDNAVNRQVAGTILGRLGCDVVMATGGQEAVELARNGGVDLVFMDLHMPDMDGFEATRRIREERTRKDISPLPIIALTAQTDETSRTRCAQAHMDGYITKPVSRDALAQVLTDMLPRPGTVQQTHNGAVAPQADDAATPPVFDHNSLHKRMGGDQSATQEILKLYLSEVPSEIEMLDRGMRERDSAIVMRQAHSLKGTTANIGAEAARYAAAALETVIKQEDWEGAASHFTVLMAALHAASDAIRDFLAADTIEPTTPEESTRVVPR